MGGIRYHAIGNEIFLKGIRRVVCYGESDIMQKEEAEALAQDIAKKLNHDLETLDFFEDAVRKDKHE